MKNRKPTAAKKHSSGKQEVSAGGDATTAAGFPIVGIGASAGGLSAFEAFFSGMPADSDPGMAFVLVQHLAPDHTSILCDLIQRYTHMEVFEVEDGMEVKINCVYIIPPGRDMAFMNGALQLFEPDEPKGHRLPIDYFFRSLAQDLHERAIGIVLSGTGSDGSSGVRTIKGEGGMVMAQNAASAEFDGMPRSAMSTGLVDYELPPAEMPARLITYATHAFGKLPGASSAPKSENAIKKLFVLLRAQTGHDFSQYKPSTIHRRIERRMAVHQIDGLDSYLKFLQQTPVEMEALFGDLLIGVTNFFRDPEVFQMLGNQVIPNLFEGRHASVRVWVAGCSTGEEAYSLAILLAEHMEAIRQNFAVQVFATDIDKRAIASARAGVYPASIAADVSPERLARFFTPEPDGRSYRIHKGIRDLVVFSEHSVIKDPPFSKLDLIICRNLMIYLGSDLQRRLIPRFHYALNPGGFLLLGTSEGTGESDDLFAVQDLKMKLYRRKEKPFSAQRLKSGLFQPRLSARDLSLPRSSVKPSFPAKLPLRVMTEQALLQQVVAAAALVQSQGDILYLHGRSGMFLEPSTGEAGVNNILRMAREGLRQALSVSLRKAVEIREPVQSPGLRVKTNGHFTRVNLTVRPVTNAADPESPLYLVILEEAPEPSKSGEGPRSPDADAIIAALRLELRHKDENLQSACEELESSNEELKSSNEEMQSVNEELATVNCELQVKVTDLRQANNDMNNLLGGTGIATVFVDCQMHILRFTPAVTQIINLIPSDAGRPVAHIASNFVSYQTLVPDVQSVLDTLASKVTEVETAGGAWFKMHIQPYRTIENVIEGAVITFADITQIVQSRDALHKANELLRLAVVVRDAHDSITVQDLDGRTIAWNPGAVRMYGWSEAEALAMNVRDRIPRELREGALDKLAQLSRSQILEPYHTQRLCKDGAVLEVSITSTALLDETGEMYAIATTERETRQDNLQ